MMTKTMVPNRLETMSRGGVYWMDYGVLSRAKDLAEGGGRFRRRVLFEEREMVFGIADAQSRMQFGAPGSKQGGGPNSHAVRRLHGTLRRPCGRGLRSAMFPAKNSGARIRKLCGFCARPRTPARNRAKRKTPRRVPEQRGRIAPEMRCPRRRCLRSKPGRSIEMHLNRCQDRPQCRRDRRPRVSR